MTTTLRLYDTPVPNDREGFTIAEDADHWYDMIPMTFNHRLVLTPKTDPRFWDYGWCYNNPTEVLLAMKVWNPETQNEPLGWKKRPTYDLVRTAPRAEEEPEYNRPRCEHNHYIGDGPCHYIGCGRKD